MQLRVLVTGASGFVGGWTLRALAAQGHAVIAATRAPVAGLACESRVVGDIGPDTEWMPALRDVDAVIHLAGRAHVLNDAETNPLALYRTINRDGAVRLARQAAAAGVRRLVLVSTIKVNGEATPDGRPFTAADEPAPADAYAIAKHEAEMGCAEVAAATGLELVIIRPPLVHGPGVKGNLAALMALIARGVPLPLGAVHNHRSLVGVENLAHALAFCVSAPNAAGKTLLIGDGQDISTADLIRKLATAMGRPARLLPIPTPVLRLVGALSGRSQAVQRLVGSLTVDDAPLRGLGWSPVATLDEGLAAMARPLALRS